MSTEVKRCAIYTRKSHEEGLEQEFNSLDAQRQAGSDYIKSQKHEGWKAITKCYDDGGFSGGTTERPALKRLMVDIERGEIDVVVVYKVDRLSRSLSDFAQLMNVFDDRGVSFVSVTQQFNTTTSMGRLTLNMLLSFAQFEREVTGERIRDKIAATAKRGLWSVGSAPLGYSLEKNRLSVIPEEAELVRLIFEGYLAHGSLVRLAEELNAKGRTTKHWQSCNGRWHGGKAITTGYLSKTLVHPVYVGMIKHKEAIWPGQHEPIIDQKTWDRVRAAMDRHLRATRHTWTHPFLLKGKLRTEDGYAMSPGSVQRPTKSNGRKRLVRYYVSQKAIKHGYKSCEIKTINAKHLDELVRALVLHHLDLAGLSSQPTEDRDHWIRRVIEAVTVSTGALCIELSNERVAECRSHPWAKSASADYTHRCVYAPMVDDHGERVTLTLDIQIKRIDGKRMLLTPDGQDLVLPSVPQPDPRMVDAFGRAYRIHERLLKTGAPASVLARELNINSTLLYKTLSLTHLSPQILRHAMHGTLPPRTTMRDLYRAAESLDWCKQESSLCLHPAKPTACAETPTPAKQSAVAHP